jgi:hypothetical protein
MDRKLASIQIIKDVLPIEGADKIELVTFNDIGWQCIAKKGEFKSGDKSIYIEIDSILPEKPDFEFLRSKKFRIKTIKLRGVLSQGIVFQTSILEDFTDKYVKSKHYCNNLCAGDDVTDIIGITKYEQEEPKPVYRKNIKISWYVRPFKKYIATIPFLKKRFGYLIGIRKTRTFPSFIPKTDELRIQSYPKFLDYLSDNKFYITQKLDGASETIYYNQGLFGVCSRNMEVYNSNCNFRYFDIGLYTKVVEKYDLKNKLTRFCKINKCNIALQGELVGPTIQGNKLGLQDTDIFFFNIYDIDKQKYVDFDDFIRTCSELNIKTVPILNEDIYLYDMTVDKLLELAKGFYDNGYPQEGMVIRPMKEMFINNLGRFSFKVVNNEFLLKEK